MDTSRDDVGIAIRSAFLAKGSKQRFSLFILLILSILLIFLETIKTKPLDSVRSVIKDTIYRGSVVVSAPSRTFSSFMELSSSHINLYRNYNELKEENNKLKSSLSKSDFLELENTQLRKLIEEEIASPNNLVSARVMLDKQSPYLNSFIINVGSNKEIKNGLAVLHGNNFIGRIVDVNFFSSRVLLITDLNSRIPVIVEPNAYHAILNGRGKNEPTLEYLPKSHEIKDGDKVYTSGKEGIFAPGIPVGEVKIKEKNVRVEPFSNLDQITFINVNLGQTYKNK